MNDFVAYSSRGRILLLILGSALFFILGLYMGGVFGTPSPSHRYSPEMVFLIGWGGVVFFSFCGLVGIKRLFDTGEQLRINQNGIHVATWSDQTIPWSEIKDVTIWSYKRQKSIVLHLRDPSLFPANGLGSLFADANHALTGGDVAISMTVTDRRVDEAMAAIAQFQP